MSSDTDKPARHESVRVRHELRFRQVEVSRVEDLTPRMRRIHFSSPELTDFKSLSADDHVKMFFPVPDGDDAARDFTPRAFDNASGTLVIDFALHAVGPATEWARAAEVGHTLKIGGPRGSLVVPDDFDWYLLIGDESALPAIGRWVETLRAGVPVTTTVTIWDENEKQSVTTAANWQPMWFPRGEPGPGDGAKLLAAVRDWSPPPGDGFVWVAGEADLVRELRAWLLHERKHPVEWLKTAGYWAASKAGSKG